MFAAPMKKEYTAALEKDRSHQTQGEKRCAERRQVNTEFKQVINAKKKGVENLNNNASQHESNIHAVEEKLYTTDLMNFVCICSRSQRSF